MPYQRGNLEIRISRNLLQNRKGSHHGALKDLEDTETETIRFFILQKKWKINLLLSILFIMLFFDFSDISQHSTMEGTFLLH